MGIMVKMVKVKYNFLFLVVVYTIGLFFGEWLLDFFFDLERNGFYRELLTSFFIAIVVAFFTSILSNSKKDK